MAVETVFTDLSSLPNGRGFCYLQQRSKRVKKICLFGFGFSCPPVSRANNNGAKSRACLNTAAGTTNKTIISGRRFDDGIVVTDLSLSL